MAPIQPWRADTVRRQRYNVTHASNRVRQNMAWMLRELPGDTVFYDGLPSWWGFWSDSLKDRVRELVRYARLLDPTGARITVTPDAGAPTFVVKYGVCFIARVSFEGPRGSIITHEGCLHADERRKVYQLVRLAAHRAADPHCTCNDCVDAHFEEAPRGIY
jgi:hypothetical protein